MHDDHPVLKDEQHERPVPTVWRSTLAKVVTSIATRDASIGTGISGVHPVPDQDAKRITANIKAYGDELVPLPEDSWSTSIYQWSNGFWEVLVDLFTANEGASDLVMFVRVYEQSDGYSYEIHDIHVP
ncbi:MAG: hypothetical protein AAFR03_11330 [Pseudomonadota bacterium]